MTECVKKSLPTKTTWSDMESSFALWEKAGYQWFKNEGTFV